jgi:hypothetical protein
MKRTLIGSLLCLLLAGCGGSDDDRDDPMRADRQPVDCQTQASRCL